MRSFQLVPLNERLTESLSARCRVGSHRRAVENGWRRCGASRYGARPLVGQTASEDEGWRNSGIGFVAEGRRRGEDLRIPTPGMRAALMLPLGTTRCAARCQDTSRRKVRLAGDRFAFRANDGEQAVVAKRCWIRAIERKAKTVLRCGGSWPEYSGTSDLNRSVMRIRWFCSQKLSLPNRHENTHEPFALTFADVLLATYLIMRIPEA